MSDYTRQIQLNAEAQERRDNYWARQDRRDFEGRFETFDSPHEKEVPQKPETVPQPKEPTP